MTGPCEIEDCPRYGIQGRAAYGADHLAHEVEGRTPSPALESHEPWCAWKHLWHERAVCVPAPPGPSRSCACGLIETTGLYGWTDWQTGIRHTQEACS